MYVVQFTNEIWLWSIRILIYCYCTSKYCFYCNWVHWCKAQYGNTPVRHLTYCVWVEAFLLWTKLTFKAKWIFVAFPTPYNLWQKSFTINYEKWLHNFQFWTVWTTIVHRQICVQWINFEGWKLHFVETGEIFLLQTVLSR